MYCEGQITLPRVRGGALPVESVEAAALIMASISLSDLMIPPKEGAVEVNADRSQKRDEWAVLIGAQKRRIEKDAEWLCCVCVRARESVRR